MRFAFSLAVHHLVAFRIRFWGGTRAGGQRIIVMNGHFSAPSFKCHAYLCWPWYCTPHQAHTSSQVYSRMQITLYCDDAAAHISMDICVGRLDCTFAQCTTVYNTYLLGKCPWMWPFKTGGRKSRTTGESRGETRPQLPQVGLGLAIGSTRAIHRAGPARLHLGGEQWM